MAEQRAKQSNPFSTGGGGVNFEVYVQTYIAMHIVTGDSLPFLNSSKPVKMKLQGHYAGYDTDDCIIFGENGEKVLCQIKHTITVSEKDPVFLAVITDAWNDYCNPDVFNQESDRILLIVSSLSGTDMNHTRALFEWAGCCENADEFMAKMTTKGFGSKEKQKKYNAIKNLIQSANGTSVSDSEIWNFLRHFSIQALELDHVDSPLFAAVSNSFSKSVGKNGLEDKLYRYIADYNQNAGTITREQLVHDLQIEDIAHNANGPAGYQTGRPAAFSLPKCFTTYIPVGPEVGLIGRDDIVDQVRAMLDSDKRVALVSGLGGIGKTAVMAQICNNIMKEGREDTYVAWVTCGDNYIDDLLSLRQALRIPKELKREEAYEVVLGKLQDLQGTLYLFLDDMVRMPDKKELGTYNALPNVRVMITSRHEIKGIPHVDLQELKKDPAVRMFYGYYGKDKEQKYASDVWEIINSDSVRSHTLLVELLAKAANASFDNLKDFRCRLEKEGFLNVSNRRFDTGRFDNKTIEESVKLLYEIFHLSPEQQRIMSLFSIFTPEKVIYGAIEEWAGFDADAVDGLVRLGWLVRVENGFVIHQIIKDSLAEQVGGSLKIEDYGELLDRVIRTRDYMPRDLEYIDVQERLVLTEDVARYLVTRTEELFRNENYAQEDKKIFNNSAALFHSMAGVFRRHGDYARALEYYGKVLSIYERVLGSKRPSVAVTYNNMALAYSDQGDYDRALEYAWKALVIKERVLGPNHPSTATTYNNMALVYSEQGDYVNALKYYERALNVRKCVLGPEHPYTAATYNNIAMVCAEQGDYERALNYYGEALSIYVRMIGTDHPSTATTYNNMAGVYAKWGDYASALGYYGKALSIRKRVLGPEHPYTGATYNNMAGVFRAQGDFAKALEYYGKALSISERVLGPEHPNTVTMYNNMAGVFRVQGDYAKALEYYEKVLAVRMIKVGKTHPYTQNAQLFVQQMELLIKLKLGIDEE